MKDSLTRLRSLHERMNGETIPLEAYFQTCPDFMFMINGSNHTIRNYNGSVRRNVGSGLYGEDIFEVISINGDEVELPTKTEDHARFFGKIRLHDGSIKVLDFNSTYIEDGDYLIIVGREPLTR